MVGAKLCVCVCDLHDEGVLIRQSAVAWLSRVSDGRLREEAPLRQLVDDARCVYIYGNCENETSNKSPRRNLPKPKCVVCESILIFYSCSAFSSIDAISMNDLAL